MELKNKHNNFISYKWHVWFQHDFSDFTGFKGQPRGTQNINSHHLKYDVQKSITRVIRKQTPRILWLPWLNTCHMSCHDIRMAPSFINVKTNHSSGSTPCRNDNLYSNQKTPSWNAPNFVEHGEHGFGSQKTGIKTNLNKLLLYISLSIVRVHVPMRTFFRIWYQINLVWHYNILSSPSLNSVDGLKFQFLWSSAHRCHFGKDNLSMSCKDLCAP